MIIKTSLVLSGLIGFGAGTQPPPPSQRPSPLEDTRTALRGDSVDRGPGIGQPAPELALTALDADAASDDTVRIDFPPVDQRPTILAFGSYT